MQSVTKLQNVQKPQTTTLWSSIYSPQYETTTDKLNYGDKTLHKDKRFADWTRCKWSCIQQYNKNLKQTVLASFKR